MDYGNVVSEIITALGGAHNIARVSICLTRLRITLHDITAANIDTLRKIHGILGVVPHGKQGLEIVCGPSAIEGTAREFSAQSGLSLEDTVGPSVNPLIQMAQHEEHESTASFSESHAHGSDSHTPIPAGRIKSYRAQQQAALESERLSRDDVDALKDFLAADATKSGRTTIHVGGASASLGKSVLIINGPNINMLGTREPGIYGKQDYSTLLRICKDAARKAGFVDVRCFQSNHEGALVDEIQGALGTFDGIVINPAAYTHTSVALLDAVKAVGLPCVEVHISDVAKREDFRQVSYVRAACFETITGLGLDGYRKAIFDLAKHLRA